MLRSFFLFLSLPIILLSCNSKENSEILPDYAFWVAGHTYGHPQCAEYGLHQPFLNLVDTLNNIDHLKLGILTGDVVASSVPAYWDSAQADINKFDMPVHIAAGNHDRGPEFLARYNSYYKSFKQGEDLFIVLSSRNWCIVGDQRDFLFSVLANEAQNSRHVFIFLHELVWWASDNIFSNVKINYTPYFPGCSNYWSELDPVLQSLDNEVFLFAGDLGATDATTPYMYYKEDNVSFIASGMGSWTHDNFILVNVLQNGEVDYKVYNKDMVEVSDLKSFQLP